MVRKKVPITKNHSPKNEDVIPRSETNLEDKIIYAIANTSVILMSTMMDAFTQVIGSTMGAIASGMAGTLGGEEASDKVDQELKQGLPGIDEKTKAGLSELRKEIYSQITQKKGKIWNGCFLIQYLRWVQKLSKNMTSICQS
jgi:hypothetical protein